LCDYLRGDALMRRFFEVFLFEDVPAADRRADALYLDEVQRCDVYVGLFGNDYGFEELFARQVRAHGQRGDLAIAISTSGNSPNVLKGVAGSPGEATGTARVMLDLSDPSVLEPGEILIAPSTDRVRPVFSFTTRESSPLYLFGSKVAKRMAIAITTSATRPRRANRVYLTILMA